MAAHTVEATAAGTFAIIDMTAFRSILMKIYDEQRQLQNAADGFNGNLQSQSHSPRNC